MLPFRSFRTRRSMVGVALCVAATLGIAGCSPATESTNSTTQAEANAGPVTFTDMDGVEVNLDKAPEKVAVLDYAALDIMESLGLSDKVVGISGAGGKLPEFVTKYDIIDGGQREPDIEALAQAEPDLIIGGPRNIGRDKNMRGKLEKVAPVANLGVTFNDFSLANNEQLVKTVAEIFGKTAEAEQELEKIRKRAEQISAKAQTAGPTLTLMASGGEISAFGPKSRFGLAFSDLGFTQAADVGAQSPRHADAVSFEFIANAKPETIFILDRDAAIGQAGEAASATLDNALVNATPAAKENRIFPIDSSYWLLVNGGLNSMNKMLDDIEAALK
ncbi:siderophore ABC transporter substrate-binding protein [Corynebacterium hindlerae]|uniref:siderophore ABC transporter substrate-binding protein n=1 Tax=Corynebacterium hindlerae TaxID=699041 RepID=UPI0031B6FE12